MSKSNRRSSFISYNDRINVNECKKKTWLLQRHEMYWNEKKNRCQPRQYLTSYRIKTANGKIRHSSPLYFMMPIELINLSTSKMWRPEFDLPFRLCLSNKMIRNEISVNRLVRSQNHFVHSYQSITISIISSRKLWSQIVWKSRHIRIKTWRKKKQQSFIFFSS